MVDPTLVYALSTPLAPCDAVTRLCTLGAAARQPPRYRNSTSIALSVAGEPEAPLLDVCVEERRRGCYVTVRTLEDRFIADLMRASRCALALCALFGAAFTLATVDAAQLVQTLCAIGAGLAALLTGTKLVERLGSRRDPRLHAARVRLAISRLVTS